MARYAEDWGKGILMSGDVYHMVQHLDEDLGMRELRAYFNDRLGLYRGKDDTTMNRFSISAEFNFGTTSIIIVREYLNSGVLARVVETDFFNDDGHWDGQNALRLMTLGAGAISLGAKLPPKLKEVLEKMTDPAYLKKLRKKNPEFAPTKMATLQLKQALVNCKECERYRYGNKTWIEAELERTSGGVAKIHEFGFHKEAEIIQSDGQSIRRLLPPPSDKQIELDLSYPYHVCGACGARTKKDGTELDLCGRCRNRQYCSKDCQVKHLDEHNKICTLPKEEMAKFLEAVFPKRLDKEVEKARASPAVTKFRKQMLNMMKTYAEKEKAKALDDTLFRAFKALKVDELEGLDQDGLQGVRTKALDELTMSSGGWPEYATRKHALEHIEAEELEALKTKAVEEMKREIAGPGEHRRWVAAARSLDRELFGEDSSRGGGRIEVVRAIFTPGRG